MGFIQYIFGIIIYQPELNILYGLFQLTGDFGVSIIILAILLNIFIYPLFAKNYINMQKTRILQPMIRDIQQKYKDNPQKMLAQMQAFNRKHGIDNSTTFKALLAQIFIISGLFFLTRDIVNTGTIEGLYNIFYGQTEANFLNTEGGLKAFGFLDASVTPRDDNRYILIPLAGAFLTWIYSMYNFKWAPKPELPERFRKKKKKKKDSDDEPLFDAEEFQKTLATQQTFIMPIILFIVQINFQTGINIYLLTSSLISLLRQIWLTNYYSAHTEELIEKIVDSDPTSKDDDPSNNLEITASPDMMAAQPVPTKVIKNSIQEAIDSKKKKTNKSSVVDVKATPKKTPTSKKKSSSKTKKKSSSK